MNETNALLHVYGQEGEHDTVYVVGNRRALMALRRAINTALRQTILDDKLVSSPGEVEVYAADGEGYDICVISNDAPWRSDRWLKLRLPYRAAWCEDGRPAVIEPEQLMQELE